MPLHRWLQDLGLSQYAEIFANNAVDFDVLTELSDADLKDLGIPLGDRKRLLRAIVQLRENLVAADTTPAPPPPHGEISSPIAAATSTHGPRSRSGAERRQLTVLFCDLVGSTTLAQRLDPEDMREVVRAYQQCCAGVIGRYEGHVAKYMGDGVLAYFGYPRAHEDDSERAVRAGLELAKAISGLGAGNGTGLAARVGIATGLVVVGDLIGEGAAQEHTVVGETPNLAARLQALAEPGSVMIAAATQHLIEGLFELIDLGPTALKGIDGPARAWRVLGEIRTSSRFEARHGQGLTPLVGREHELGLLLDRWSQAREGDGQVILLAGEPGIGKSRILLALRERVADQPHTRLRYFCSPYHTNTAFHPILDQLERGARIERDDLPDARLDKLETLFALSGKDGAEATGMIASLLSIPTGTRYPPVVLTPQARKAKVQEILLQQVVGLASDHPVLMLLEDAHWIDPTSLEQFDLVIERIQRLPVLIVITFRPEFQPPWTRYPHITSLSLNRLSCRQSVAMVERITGGKGVPDEVLGQIVEKADGVPLFLEELTKAVLESGLLEDAGDRYRLAGPLPPLAIPATLQDSLMARLDRLAPVKEVAQIASVIGREFPHDLLVALSPLPEVKLNEALGHLMAAELVFRRGVSPNVTYAFKHALVQDAAYASLLRGRRQQLHARIGQVLEGQFPEAAEVAPEVLARHYTEGSLEHEAVRFWLKAAQQAVRRRALREAIAHARRGIELIAGIADSPARHQLEIPLQTTLGLALQATQGPVEEVRLAFARADDLCRQTGDVCRRYKALWGLWFWNEHRMHFETARELAHTLLSLAEQEGDEEMLLQAHHANWTTLLYRGELEEARTHAQQGIALYRVEDHHAHCEIYAGHDVGACSHYTAGLCTCLLGFPDEAVRQAEQALELGERLAHPFTLSLALTIATIIRQIRAEVDVANRLAERLIAVASEHDIAVFRETGCILNGWLLAARGESATGIQAIKDALDELLGRGAGLRRSYFLWLLADASTRAGDHERGWATLSEALAFVQQRGERWWEAELHRLQGQLLLRRGHAHGKKAEGCYQTALEIARLQGAKLLELRAATSLAGLWTDQGERQKAHDLLAPVCGWFTEGFDTADLKDAKALLNALV
jgi:class 3 adenylate cyclase/predicted ATPase